MQHSEAVFPHGWPFRAEKLLFIGACGAPDGPRNACRKNDHYFLKDDRFFLKHNDHIFLKEDHFFLTEDHIFLKDDRIFLKGDHIFLKNQFTTARML